mmetsp:Transcript_1007/g.3396  ORF Transcript_1007/g.3396 Transcript_1007/m.3396 type:complete len:224 (-) Transcript_1007:333-1004(-)
MSERPASSCTGPGTRPSPPGTASSFTRSARPGSAWSRRTWTTTAACCSAGTTSSRPWWSSSACRRSAGTPRSCRCRAGRWSGGSPRRPCRRRPSRRPRGSSGPPAWAAGAGPPPAATPAAAAPPATSACGPSGAPTPWRRPSLAPSSTSLPAVAMILGRMSTGTPGCRARPSRSARATCPYGARSRWRRWRPGSRPCSPATRRTPASATTGARCRRTPPSGRT